MRILHVIDSLNVGGAEKLVTGLSEASLQSGCEVELYVLQSGGRLESDAAKADVPVHCGSPGSPYSPVHVLRLARFLKKHRQFDIIHVHLYPAQLWVCLAVRLAGCSTPVVTTEHSTSNRRRTALFRRLDRWMYHRFSAVAVISEAAGDALLAHVGRGIPMVRVVPNGIDAARFRFILPRREPKTAGLVVLSIGSLTRVKDQATVIRAIAGVDGARLVLAGDGPLRKELEDLASRLGVRARVEFLGIRSDIPQLIAASDLYVQASLWEGFCLAVVEAMCGGLPCIASRNAGLEEVVGPAGVYFEPGNADELAAEIRKLTSDPGRRAVLTGYGVERAKKFTLEACLAGYGNLYREAIARRLRGCPDSR